MISDSETDWLLRRICIDDAHIQDAAKIVDLQNRLFHEKWSEQSIVSFLTQQYSTGLTATPKKEFKQIPTLAGYLIAMQSVDTLEIVSIGIDPSLQRQGLGRFLIDSLLQRSQKIGKNEIFLEVACNNVAAISLYQSSGFDTCGKRKKYYRTDGKTPPTDALILSRTF